MVARPRDRRHQGRREARPSARARQNQDRGNRQGAQARKATGPRPRAEGWSALAGSYVADVLAGKHRVPAERLREHLFRVRGGRASPPRTRNRRALARQVGSRTPRKALREDDPRRQGRRNRAPRPPYDPERAQRGQAPWPHLAEPGATREGTEAHRRRSRALHRRRSPAVAGARGRAPQRPPLGRCAGPRATARRGAWAEMGTCGPRQRPTSNPP
jgi:hypothetical protein